MCDLISKRMLALKRKNTFSFLKTRILFFLRTKLIGHRYEYEFILNFQHGDVVTHSSAQLVLRSCVLFDASLKLHSNYIRIGSINKLVFKKLVLSPDEFLGRNSSGDTYEKEEDEQTSGLRFFFFPNCKSYRNINLRGEALHARLVW